MPTVRRRGLGVLALTTLALASASAGGRTPPALTPFRALNQVFVTDRAGSFRATPHGLDITGFGNLWTPRVAYDLTYTGASCTVRTRARLTKVPDAAGKLESAELILGFSSNRLPWGTPGADAITFRIATDADEHFATAVRTKVYDRFVARSDARIAPDTWVDVVLTLRATELVATADGREILRSDLSAVEFPLAGYVGLMGFRSVPWEVSRFEIEGLGKPKVPAPESEPAPPASGWLTGPGAP